MELIHGDCLIELKKLKDKSIDFVYLDLPYGQTSCKWDKKIDHHALWIELKRIAKSDRTPFFFSCTTKFGFELFNSAPKGYFRWDLVWEKNRAAGFLNAYKLPMRKHEMVYCFAKKTPEYDVSSHKYHYEDNPRPRKTQVYGLDNKEKIKAKIYDDPLPTSILPPQEESDCFTYSPKENHELVYCFAKKTPEYDVSSHSEYTLETSNREEQDDNYEVYGKLGKGKKKVKSKTHKDPLPTSILPPHDDHELVYCFAKKTPEYDVSSHKFHYEDNPRPRKTEVYAIDNPNKIKAKIYEDPLPTSVLPDIPSSWCKFKLDEKINHRTSKPIKLMEFLLKYWSKEGDTVLDPTAGSGSMGIACKNMNRNFIGIEKDDDIFKIMKDRIENHKPPDKSQEAQP